MQSLLCQLENKEYTVDHQCLGFATFQQRKPSGKRSCNLWDVQDWLWPLLLLLLLSQTNPLCLWTPFLIEAFSVGEFAVAWAETFPQPSDCCCGKAALPPSQREERAQLDHTILCNEIMWYRNNTTAGRLAPELWTLSPNVHFGLFLNLIWFFEQSNHLLRVKGLVHSNYKDFFSSTTKHLWYVAVQVFNLLRF